MIDRRRIIRRDARRRYADGRRLGLDWSWRQRVATAAVANKIRSNEPRAILAEAAAIIRAQIAAKYPDQYPDSQA